jgi:hypothetical protein
MPDPRPYVAGSSSLVLGADSYTVPTELDDREYVFGQNVVCRGGILQTRPGSRSLFCLPDGNFQGATLFTPDNGVAQIVAAVDGKIYVSAAPFTSYRRLWNLQFSPVAKYVAWASCLKSTDYDPDGMPISLENPYSVLVMQDGLTRAAYWDGGTSGHLNPADADLTDVSDTLPGINETPVGLWMIWSGNRLWVSRGNQIFASDLGNPLKFTEALYLNEARAFVLNSPCTGMIEIPSGTGEDKGFIAFTESDGTLFQSYIQDRTQWLNTPLFQNTVLPNIGCVAPRSLVTQYGLNWWFGPRGFTNLNAAFRQNLSSRIDYQDNQMFASKAYLGPDLSNICASFYENYLMVSVPSGDVLNRHTWVLDQAPFDGNANAWTGIWTGWRPIEWARGIVNGSERLFFGSIDYDGKNRIWECMLPERTDNGCRITCYAQLRDHAAGDMEDKRYEWTKFFLSQILGEVDLNVYVASTKGGFQFQKNYHIVASEGQVFADQRYSEVGPLLIGNRVQSRTIRTPADPEDNECNACGVESKEGNMIDYAFSHLLVWSGQMGLRAYQIYMREYPDRQTGDCEIPEAGPRTLTAQGCSGLQLLVDGEVFERFTAFAEGTAVANNGAGIYIRRESVSYISQENAQALADCAVEKIIAQLSNSDLEPGVYDSTAAEIGDGTYVVVNSVSSDVTDEPPPVDERARVLIYGGGGGGAIGGGGGGDGEEYLNVVIPGGTNPVVIGAGGTPAGASVAGPKGGTGGTTTFLGYSKTGGGGGGNTGVNGNQNGNSGASGGGAGAYDGGVSLGGTGAPGGNGGTNGGFTGAPYPAGGGGGRGGPGTNAPSGVLAGSGGPGFTSDISGASLGYCGGGGAQCYLGGGAGSGSDGGSNGSPAGSALPGQRGGGGGGTGNGSNGGAGSPGGLIVRYTGAPRFTGGTITTVGGDTVHTFDTAGLFSLDSI